VIRGLQLGFSDEAVVTFVAVGAVIFLFSMDYYYRLLEARADEEKVDANVTIEDDSTERDIAA
jgi:hypothetical protein